MRAPQMLGAATILELLCAFTIYLDPVSAASRRANANGLSARANNAAGIGVEVECSQIRIRDKNNNQFTPEQLEKLKGQTMNPIGFDGGRKTNWKLTAEIVDKDLIPESIVDGIQNKVGAHKTKDIGKEISAFMNNWKPQQGAQIDIPGFPELNPFKVKWPVAPVAPQNLIYSTQVTTAMPLAAVLQILSDSRENKPNPLGSEGSRFRTGYKILTKKDFAPFQKIKESDITDEFLGFFSLLTSYCVLAKDSVAREGPKYLVNIMPRTDFTTQYNKFIEPKLKEQLKEKDSSLYDIVKKVSGSGDSLATEKFKWTPRAADPVDGDWEGKNEDLKAGTMEVRKFLNYLPQRDLLRLMDQALRHNQIGALKDKMENMFESDIAAPLFEFRDVGRYTGGDKFVEAMGTYEDKVIEYHHQFGKGETVNNKPSKGKSLSIAMRTTVSPHAGYADVDNSWEFYTTSVGKAVGSCGETDGEKLTVQGGSSSTKLDPKLSAENPPWPAGTFKLKIEGQDCEYKCDGNNPGRLFCPNRQITCVEDTAKSKKDKELKCGTMSFFHATVYCDF